MIYTTAQVNEALLDLACRALERAGCEPLTRSYRSVGMVAWDDCGQLTVGSERIYRSIEFPNEYFGPEYCFAGFIALQTLIVLTRCVPVPDDLGEPPAADDVAAAHAVLEHDAAVLWNVASGALPDGEWERAALSQSYVGNQGGIVAIETRFTLGLDSDSWCP